MVEHRENMCRTTPKSSPGFYSCGDGKLSTALEKGCTCKFYDNTQPGAFATRACNHLRHISLKGIEDYQCMCAAAQADYQHYYNMEIALNRKLEML